MKYFASAAIGLVGIVALTATGRRRSCAMTKAIVGMQRRTTTTVRNTTSTFIQMTGNGPTPTTINIGGANTTVPVTGAAAYGLGSRQPDNDPRLALTPGTFSGGNSFPESFGKAARSSPEPIARSGKRNERARCPVGLFLCLSGASPPSRETRVYSQLTSSPWFRGALTPGGTSPSRQESEGLDLLKFATYQPLADIAAIPSIGNHDLVG